MERAALQAMVLHALAASFHAEINDPRHRNASEAHARKRDSFVTRLEDYKRRVKQHWPPSNNKGAFDWFVENERRTKRYRKSGKHANRVVNLLEGAEVYPTLANINRNKALWYQPARLACGVD